MNSIPVDVFFSCSFADGDAEINDHFMAIARALGLRLTNVSTASSATPPDVAKAKISTVQALVAICTRRDEFKDGGFAMPQAVHDEISFAYGAKIPVLMFVEDEVQLTGFKSNFGTHLKFERSKLLKPDFLEKSIEAIHTLKLEVVEPHHVGSQRGVSDAHAEYVHHMVEMKFDGQDFLWAYNTSKKLIYTKPSKRGFPASIWATVPANLPEIPPQIKFQLKTINSSRGIKLVPKIEFQTPEKIEAIVALDPSPEEGDFIEYATIAESRYINPVWSDEVAVGGGVHLDSSDYQCADGLIFIHRTKSAILEFRFPMEYGFRKSDIRTFVGSYTSAVDYEVPSEIDRAIIKVDEFGGNLIIRMELSSPLPGHMYGIAWNPRSRPELTVPLFPDDGAL